MRKEESEGLMKGAFSIFALFFIALMVILPNSKDKRKFKIGDCVAKIQDIQYNANLEEWEKAKDLDVVEIHGFGKNKYKADRRYAIIGWHRSVGDFDSLSYNMEEFYQKVKCPAEKKRKK